MADELVSVLGFDASQAISTLNTLDTALQGYTTAMRGAAAATRKFNKAASSVDAQLKSQSNVIKGFATTTSDLNKAQRQGVAAAEKSTKAHKDHTKAVEKLGKKTKTTGQVMVLSWQSVTRVFLLQGIHSAISNITAALAEGAVAARKYEISLAEIQTIGRDLNLTMDQVSERVREVSEAFGIPIATVTEATYQTLSNQVTEAANTFDFLQSASTLAIGAVTSLDSAVDLLSSVINSYGFNARDADEISGKLFRTIDLGRIRGEELANTFGRVLVLASQVGISFDEVNAAMATYTVSGLKANEAMTLLTNAMLKLIRPTDALKDVMTELGITSAEAGIQAFGFQGFLQQITKEAGSSATEIGKLFGRIRATRAIMGVSNEQAEIYAENLRQIKDAGEADIFRARKTVLEIDAKQLERDIEAVKNFFTVDLGQAINSALLSLSQFAGGGVTAIKAVGVAVLTATALFVGLKITGTAAFIALTTGATTFAGVLAAAQVALGLFLTPLGLIIGAGVAVGAAYVVASKIINKTSIDTFKAIEKASRISIKKQISQIKKRQKAEKEVNDAILSDTQKFLFKRQKLFVQDQKRAERLESLVLTSFRDQVQNRLSEFEGFVDGLRSKSGEAAEAIRNARDEISGIGRDISTFRFDRELVGLDAGQVVARQVEQANKLRREAQRAIREGDFDRAKELQTQALSLNQQALQSADQLKSRTAISKIERSIVSTYKEQQNLQKSIVADQKKQEEVAERERASSEASLNRLKQAVTELDDLEIAAFGDPEKAKAAFAEVTASIEREFRVLGSKISISDFLGLQTYIKNAMEPLRDPTTGQKARLDLIIDPNIDLIFDTLQGAWKSIPEEAKLQISDITGTSFSTAEGFAPLIQGVVEIVKVNKDINELEFKRAELQNTQLTNLTKRKEIESSIVNSLGIQEGIGRSVRALGFIAVNTDKQRLEIIKAFSAVQQDLAAGNVEGVTKQIEAFEAYKLALQAEVKTPLGGVKGKFGGLDSLIKNLELLVANYTEAVTIRNELLVTPVATGERNQQIQELGNALTQVNQTAVQTEAAVQQANVNTTITIKQKTAAVQEYLRTLRQANQPSDTVTKHGITITRRAAGGGIGTDTVPAMLTPGEFVVNAKSANKFFPQLVAMNSGIKPIFRQDGGTVTNVGDVNIHVQGSAEPKQTARETLKAFRRILRRDA